jgi:hypothetical protein
VKASRQEILDFAAQHQIHFDVGVQSWAKTRFGYEYSPEMLDRLTPAFSRGAQSRPQRQFRRNLRKCER